MAVQYMDAGTVEYPSGGEATNFTLSLPAGTLPDDLFIVNITSATRDTPATLTGPSGSTVLDPLSSPEASGISAALYWWEVPASVPPAITFTWSQAQRGTLAWIRLRGSSELVLDAASYSPWVVSAQSVTAPSIVTTAPNCYVLGGMYLGSGSTVITPPTGWTQRTDASQREGHISTKGIQAAPGPTGSATFTHDWNYPKAWQIAVRESEPDTPGATVDFFLAGAVTDSSARVNVRTVSGEPGSLLVSTSATLTNPVATVSGQGTGDNMWKFPIAGLSANTTYYYGLDSTRVGRFRTFPTAGQPATFTIAAASCNVTSSNATTFERIQNRNPAFFYHMGDWGYPDIETNSVSLYRAARRENLTQPRQASLFANVPMAYTWDDHDFGPNNSVGSHVGKPAAQQVFREFVPHYPLPADTRPGGNGEIYQTFVVGRVRMILLDCKSNRSAEEATDNASKTTLGADQKAWLKQTLLSATEPLIILGVSEPWIDSTGEDGWGMYSTERAELSQFFEDNGLTSRLLLLHGDAHMLAADDGTNTNYAPSPVNPKGPPVFNFAPLDQSNSIKGGPYSGGTYTGSQTQYGTLDVVDDGTTITVTGRGWQVNGSAETNVLTMTATYAAGAAPVPTASSLTAPAGRWVKGTLRPVWRSGQAWKAILPTADGHRLDTLTPSGIIAGSLLDVRQDARPTAIHESGTTYVLMGHTSSSRLHVLDAANEVVRTSTVPLTVASHDSSPISLHRSPNGYLWVTALDGAGVKVTRSTDGGVSWSTPVTLVAAATTGTVALTQAGQTVVLMATGNDGSGRWVRTIDQGASTITPGQWATETLPSLPSPLTSDDHMSALSLGGGRVLYASKTSGSTSGSQMLLHSLLRGPDGSWSVQQIEGGPDDLPGYTRPVLTLAGSLAVVHYGAFATPYALSRRTLNLAAGQPQWSARTTVALDQRYSDSAAAPVSGTESPWPIVSHTPVSGDLQVFWVQEWADPPEHPMYVGTRRVVEVRLGSSLVYTSQTP